MGLRGRGRAKQEAQRAVVAVCAWVYGLHNMHSAHKKIYTLRTFATWCSRTSACLNCHAGAPVSLPRGMRAKRRSR